MGYTNRGVVQAKEYNAIGKPLSPTDREIALLRATTRLTMPEIAARLSIHPSTVLESLYKPKVEHYIAELIEKRERMLIEQSVATLIADQQEEYKARARESDDLRAYNRQRRSEIGSKNLAAWRAAQRAKRPSDNENE